MSDPTASLLESAKGHLPKWASVLLSATFFIATLLVNFGSSKTHMADQLAEQDKRLSTLEEIVKNDLATRRELDDVKSDVKDVKGMLLEELRHHGLR